MRYAAVRADLLEFLKTQPADSFDALLCDPPYGLEFMNKKWDYDVPSVEQWAECIRVLKPGAPILAFGGSRTFHRIALGLEDAGAELCDTIMWVFARGMPKPATTTDGYIDSAHGIKRMAKTEPVTELARRWEGYGHALRPSHEPIAVACKPYDGTIAHNVLTHGTGAINIAACQLGRKTHENPRRINEGCWPANVILSHAPECRQVGTREVRTGTAVKRNGVSSDSASWGGQSLGAYAPGTPDCTAGVNGKETIGAWECTPDCPIRQMDEQSGERPSNPFPEHDAEGAVLPLAHRSAGGLKDTGGASRFFFHAKVNRQERERGCEAFPLKTAAEATNRREGTAGANRPQAGAGRGSGCRNFHPTLKPIDLTTYLARLLLPPTQGAVLLNPFAGAGSELIGALLAGWPAVLGIEREEEYLPLLHARVAAWVPGAVRLAA